MILSRLKDSQDESRQSCKSYENYGSDNKILKMNPENLLCNYQSPAETTLAAAIDVHV
jgi:hypothetical protein